MLITYHNAGFFACCSQRLENIIDYYNNNKRLPENVDSSRQFQWYKNNSNDDVTYDYFEHYDTPKNREINVPYTQNIIFNNVQQFDNFQKLDFKNIIPIVNKYFSPQTNILDIISDLENRYNITDYENMCVLFYRGNDKITETTLSSYEEVIEKANIILSKNKNIKFLIQSDETNFIARMLNEFPNNSFFLNNDIRHVEKQNNSIDLMCKDSNYIFSKKFLAITIIMSKCKYIIFGSGNCSLWILFYRNNADNIMQYLNGNWYNSIV